MLKVCVVVASRANYGRVKSLMREIQRSSELELQLIVGASLLIERFGKAVNVVTEDGFEPNRAIYYMVEGENLITQAKSTGLGIIELATAFSDLKPDFVVSVADRFETMSTAIAATYTNTPLIHIQGGEVSGNIDDRVRHSISKLADFHFVATERSKERLIRMGEPPHSVFNFGCPAMDIIAETDLGISNSIMEKYGGVGAEIDWSKPYLLMIQHPVTTSFGRGLEEVRSTLNALNSFLDMQKVVLWPNADAGGEDVAKGIRVFRESSAGRGFHFYRNFSPEDFLRVLANCKCAVGNSSSFLREGEFLNIPAVMVGDRQKMREHGDNVVFVGYDAQEIENAIQGQLRLSRQVRSGDSIFGRGDAGKRIASVIPSLRPSLLKGMTY